MALKIFSFRLDESLVAQIDAVDPARSEFVRGAIKGALSKRPSTKTSTAVTSQCPKNIQRPTGETRRMQASGKRGQT